VACAKVDSSPRVRKDIKDDRRYLLYISRKMKKLELFVITRALNMILPLIVWVSEE